MSEKYNINIGNPYQYPFDENSINEIDSQLEYLHQMKSNIQNKINSKSNNNKPKHSIWDDISKEVQSLSNSEQQELLNNENYQAIDQQIQGLINQALFESVKQTVAESEIGKELLTKQLNFIRSIKEQIVINTNKKAELLKQFQLASERNPDLTYKEFIKSLE